MALSVYCQNCGAPTFYTLSKPRFCSNCGNDFVGASQTRGAVQTKPAHQVIDAKPSQDLDDPDDVQIELSAPLDTSDIEIATAANKGVKMLDLVKQHKIGLPPRPKQKLSKKKFQEEWQQEAGTRGKNSPAPEVGETN